MRKRTVLVSGLLVGAWGIAILWAAGVDFPIAVPPGLVILVVGAAVVLGFQSRWADAVGGFLGLFVVVGFVLSGINGEGSTTCWATTVPTLRSARSCSWWAWPWLRSWVPC